MTAMDERLTTFNLGTTYEPLGIIREGNSGIVCSAIPTQRKVAIKRIAPFDHSMFCLRTLREIKLLRHFRHENIISILDILPPPSIDEFSEVYLVQELMETDLHRVIRTNELTDDHCQYLIYQALRALKALHSADILHRNLKPSSLLLNANCDLKLCGFGLACSARPRPIDPNTFMAETVAIRWYRAPEAMLTFKEYTRAIDMWSVGCILAEMLSGKPLFPGRDYHHQLSITFDIIGTPSIDDFYAITSQRSREYIRSLPFRKKKNFTQLFPKANPLAIDLMEKCLTFSPKRRIEVSEALKHPYLQLYHDPLDEPTAEPPDPSFFDLEDEDALSKEQLKVLIYDEITRPNNTPVPFLLSASSGRYPQHIADKDSDIRPPNNTHLPGGGPLSLTVLKASTRAPHFRRFSSDIEQPSAWLRAKREALNTRVVSDFNEDADRMACAAWALSCNFFPHLALDICATLPDLSGFKASLTVWKSWDVLTSLCKFREINYQFFSTIKDMRQYPGLGDDLMIDIDEVCIHIYQLTADAEQYRRFLELRDNDAQSVLDLLQALLDLPKLDKIFRAPFVNALLRLSKKSGVYPSSLLRQHGVFLEGTDAVAAGHFGDIWRGRCQGQEVAVKVLKIFLNSDQTKEFQKILHEMLIWRQLRHPNVLPFLCLHHVHGNQARIGLVSPWMENGNVQTYLYATPNVHRDSLIIDIAEGLEYLHGMEPSIVHGDLKAVNILVTNTHRACLADFGLSTASGSGVLQLSSFSSGITGGTSRWMAPELFDGTQAHSTKFSDAYSFGCVCYEIFSGTIPFSDLNDHAVIFAVVTGRRPLRPSHWAPQEVPCEAIGLNDNLWNLIERCWGKDPQHRPSMRNVLNSLSPQPRSSRENFDLERYRPADERELNLLSWLT